MKFNTKNFFKHTYCEFEQVNFDFSEVQQFESKSGSKYHYTKNGVYRYSNHWGRVANCRWVLSRVKKYKNQSWYVGFANWTDFFDLNAVEKCFFIDIDLASEEVFIKVENDIENSKKFLCTINQAIRRKKEIHQVLKNDKWMRYVNLNKTELKKELIIQVTNSFKSISDIKAELYKK